MTIDSRSGSSGPVQLGRCLALVCVRPKQILVPPPLTALLDAAPCM